MTKVELKRCPFCGREASIRRNLRTGHTAIQCDYCRAWWTPAEHLTRNEITEAWNRRADEMKTYRDSRGWLYRVMQGLGEDNYKARYNKPGCRGWKCVANLPWRKTWEDAEQDLAEYAQQKKMETVE